MGRFAEPARWILVALQGGPRTLVGLLDDVRRLDGRVGHGTLVGAVARLERRGLIQAVLDGSAPPHYRSVGRTMRSQP
jgi:DNA-binding PadR family transcriptional regulator